MIAKDDVFATLELFEAIFLFLSHRDLLVSALRVSHSWRNTILSSSLLQQRLFLATAPANTPWIQNPILAAKFWPFFRDVRRTNDFAEELRAQSWGSSYYNLNPCMRFLMAGTHRLGAMECFSDAGREVYFRPEASWRKMLVIQPPVDVLRIYQHGMSREDAEWSGAEWLDPRKEIYSSRGLTMWDMFAQAVPKLDGWSSGGMGFQWNMWDVVNIPETTEGGEEEDEDQRRSASRHVVVEDEPRDSVTLVYVEWWMDRNQPALRNGQEEGPELRGMAGMEIVPGQENSKRKGSHTHVFRQW